MKPTREHATNNRQTYFVSSTTAERRVLFQTDRWARLFIDVLYQYREKGYLLHEFVLMHDHFHLVITPKLSLERAVQFLKGGFSYQAKVAFDFPWQIWQRGFSDHRIRDAGDYRQHKIYVHLNPVRKGLVRKPEEYPYSSAAAGFELDPLPQWLKPLALGVSGDTANAVSFQNSASRGTTNAVSLQNSASPDTTDVVRQNSAMNAVSHPTFHTKKRD